MRLLYLILFVATAGCGSTKSRLASEQLLISDAVDQAVASIDFRSLAGENVYFDTRYLVNVKGVGFVNAEYIISSLRQQMVAADVRLKEKAEDAEYVVEARVGTLGSDGSEIIYGIPANKGLSEASSMVPGAPPLPAIPEISIARKEAQLGAVKVAAFAYDRNTGSPVWQSGMARTRTTAQDVWLFGAGPFQRGSIHRGTEFAGSEMEFQRKRPPGELDTGPPVVFDKEFYFPHPVDTQVARKDGPPQPGTNANPSLAPPPNGGGPPPSNTAPPPSGPAAAPANPLNTAPPSGVPSGPPLGGSPPGGNPLPAAPNFFVR